MDLGSIAWYPKESIQKGAISHMLTMGPVFSLQDKRKDQFFLASVFLASKYHVLTPISPSVVDVCIVEN